MKSTQATGNLTLNERYFDELLMQNGKVRRLQHADGFINLSQDGTFAKLTENIKFES